MLAICAGGHTWRSTAETTTSGISKRRRGDDRLLGRGRGRPDPRMRLIRTTGGDLPETYAPHRHELLMTIDEARIPQATRRAYEVRHQAHGMGKDAPGGAQLKAASRVVHPGHEAGLYRTPERIMKEMGRPVSGTVKPRSTAISPRKRPSARPGCVRLHELQATPLI